MLFADLDSTAAQAAADESRKVASNPTYRTLARAVDVTDEAQVESTVAEMVAEFGRISCVVNSAGVGPPFPPPRSLLVPIPIWISQFHGSLTD